MTLLEQATHSFVVKFWLEEPEGETSIAVWRGHITHIPSNRRRYINSLKEMKRFVKPYLKNKHIDIQESE
jgi:phage pi2 protein 07